MPDANHTAVGQDCPIVQTLAITPANTNLAALPRALWIGNGGSVEILAAGDISQDPISVALDRVYGRTPIPILP